MNQPDTSPRPEDWADAVASATHVVREDQRAGRAARGDALGKSFYLVLLGVVVALGVAVVSPRLTGPEPPRLAAREQGADLREEVAVLVEQIEAYRTEHGSLPDPRLLAPYLEGGYEYAVTNAATGEFIVRRTAGGVTVTYDGSLPLGLWLVMGGSSGGNEP